MNNKFLKHITLFAIFPPYTNESELKEYLNSYVFPNDPESVINFIKFLDFSLPDYSNQINSLTTEYLKSIAKLSFNYHKFQFITNEPILKFNSPHLANSVYSIFQSLDIDTSYPQNEYILLDKLQKQKVLTLLPYL